MEIDKLGKKNKILVASWAWRPVGGDWTYIENMNKLYESKGFEVIPFSTLHQDNINSEFEKYFIKAFDYKALNKKKSIKSSFQALKNSIISFEALKKLDVVLSENEILFAHLHIIHHWITPAIVWKLKKKGIPIIWSLHEYKILCPEGSFVSKGSICEKCNKNRFYNCAINKCKKNSFLASSLAALDAYFYNLLGVYKNIDAYLCPSEFLLNKFKQFGFNENKFYLTNLCYDISSLDDYIKKYQQRAVVDKFQNQRYILYVGRIEKLKGIKTLIDAVAGTNIQLKVAGTGAYLEEIQNIISFDNITNVEFLGFIQKSMIYELTLCSVCVVCPSEWYENYPYSIIESLLLSKPVVGSNIGGIPELVKNGYNGFIHEPGDVIGLREAILKIWDDSKKEKELGINARSFAASKVNYITHWSIIERIINKVIN